MQLVHGSNLRQKETQRTKYRDALSRAYLSEIRTEYDRWHNANVTLFGPARTPAADDAASVQQRVALFEQYKTFLDQQQYAEKFDSRSNLHSSALEEFLYYLFRDLVAGFGPHTLIGKSHTFKDLFFVPPSYAAMLRRPYAQVEIKDHDFVIGTTVQAAFRSSTPLPDPAEQANPELSTAPATVVGGPAAADVPGEMTAIVVEKPLDYAVETVTADTETRLFDVPVIAIECKTYLDKAMLEGSSRAAEELKARNPNGLYIVVMERIKLSEAVNLRKYKVDQIYILRQQKNTDREFTFAAGYIRTPIDPAVVWHLYDMVRSHLTRDWVIGLEQGIRRGYLL